MDKSSFRYHDISRLNGHHTLGIAEKVIMPFKKNTCTVEFEKIDDLTIFIMINYHKIIY